MARAAPSVIDNMHRFVRADDTPQPRPSGQHQEQRRRGPKRFAFPLAVLFISSRAFFHFVEEAAHFRRYFPSAGNVATTEASDLNHIASAAAFGREHSHSGLANASTSKIAASTEGDGSMGGGRDPPSDRFVPTRNRTSWIVPTTAFTPHILSLVDIVKESRERCTSPRGKFAFITLSVRPPATVSVDLAAREQKHDAFIFRWYKSILLNKIFHPGSGRILPTGNVTFGVSGDDRNEIGDVCFFANSSPKGVQAVFNFEDIRGWAKDDKLPAPLPWNEREVIPVFRGRLWGVSESHLRAAQRELEDAPNATTDVADEAFFRNVLNSSGVHMRGALVYFSKQHPDLVNARIHGYGKFQANLWVQNATNGMHRLLPLDEIPADEYFTRYQTHVVMGGTGAAFRLARIMGQTAAAILQEYPYEEWFAHLLEPYVHYIPLRQDLTDLNETLRWVRENPSKVHQIAKNGKVFHDEYLTWDKIGEFYHELIFRLMLCCGTLT